MAGLLSTGFGLGAFVTGSGGEMAQALAAAVLVAAYYVLLYGLLGERLFARAHPWFGATILLGSLAVLTAPFVPEPVKRGVGLYVGVALIVTAVIRYGGCEVVAPWTLLFGRHYVLYCPFNAVDLVERPFHRLPMNLAVGVAAAITAVVGIYFVLGRDVLERLDLSEPIAPRWALLLLVPAGLLAYQAVRTHRDDARVLLFGVAVLVLLALYFAELIPVQGLWELVMLVGLLYATGRMVISIVRRRQTR